MPEVQPQIADLDPQQLELLMRRLQKAGRKPGGAAGRETISRRQGEGPWPLSFPQQRLWFIHQLAHRSTAYHIPIRIDLSGALCLPHLEAALEGVAQRHEALRTTFDLVGGRPVQVIHPRLRVALPLIDLTALPGPAREAELARQAELEAARPFDLSHGPLLRGLALRHGPDRFRLVLVLHHIAADNWSVLLLMREVSALYDALVQGIPAHLPEVPIQYADFAVWQLEKLKGEALESQLAFWRRSLDGAPRRLDLPADHARPELPSFRSGRLVLRLGEELALELKTLARQHGTTLYNVLLAAWSALLFRYTGQEDIIVGSPAANRRRTELEGLIGCFVNTLLMRSRPHGALPFQELLGQVHESSLAAFAHQDLPFEKIVEDLRPERDSTYQPLFQVMFNVYDGAMPELRFRGVDVAGLEVQIGTWNDLDLLLVETRLGIQGYLRYSLDLFEPATAEALAASFREILEEILRAPRSRLSELPLVPALAAQAEAARRRERKRSIVVSATFTAEPLGDVLDFWMRELEIPSRVLFAPYHQVFQQLLDPASLLGGNRDGVNVVLVRFEDWTEHRGEDGGARPLDDSEVLGGIERSGGDLIAALQQAAQRAAAPYVVFLCPASPRAAAVEPFRALCDALEARARAELAAVPGVHLVGAAELSDRYPADDLHDPYTDRIGHIPYAPTGFAALGTLIARTIHALVSPPAKVIVLDCDQTLWKGVCGEDGPQGVVLDPARRRLQEIVLAQARQGLLLCLCSKNQEDDVWNTFDQRPDFPLRQEDLTAWRINWSPKSENLRSLADELNLGLDSFILIDDNPVECAEVRASCPEVLVLELPAEEDAIPRTLEHFWAFDRLRTTAEDRERTVLYRQMLERERHRRSAASFQEFLDSLGLVIDISPLVPERLARAAQLTQRTNQFNASTVRRLEGEIQRLVSGGELECWTVSVRDRFGDHGLVGTVLFGERPDALEVDTFLLSCRVLGRGVEHRILAALGAEARRRGLGRVDVLVAPTAKNRPAFDFLRSAGGAFEVAREGGSVFRIPAEVAEDTRFSPAASPPEQTERAESAPASAAPSGAGAVRSRRLGRIAAELFDARQIRQRIDESTRKLQAGGGAREYVPPAGAVEERLAGLFSEVLGIERVGSRDSFFELGGHSLLGTVLLSRIRDAFGAELPIRRLFERPSVSLLAVEVEQLRASEADLQAPLIRQSPCKDGSYPLSFSQQRIWFLDRWEPNSAIFNMPTAIRLRGNLSLPVLEASVDEIVRRHEILRAHFPELSGEPVMVVDAPIHRSVPLLDLTALPEGVREVEAKRLEHREALRPFDLQTGPPIRVALLRLSLDDHTALVTLHHIVADGWSLRLLTDELSAHYSAFLTGTVFPLPELPVQFADYSVWQRQWLRGEALERELAFWRKQLAGIPEFLDVPLDRPRPSVQRYRGRRLPVSVSDELAAALRKLGRRSEATMFMVLATAWKALLRRYSNQDDIAVGTLIANRHRREVESLIGFFVNTLVLRTRLAADLTLRQALASVRETTLDVYSHQDLPFEKLVEELNPERHLSLTPLFQVMLVLQNTPPATLDLPGLRLEAVEVERNVVNYDLYLMLEETDTSTAGHLAWNVDLFDGSTVARMLAHFETMARALAEDLDRRILDVPLLGEAERQHVLVEWNDAEAADFPPATAFLDLLAEQVRLRPDAPAAADAVEEISYRELGRRVERAAGKLAGLGIRPGDVVALLADRSLDFLVAILSLFRCGGAYLPLDPGHPDRRIGQILAASGVPLVLVSDGHGHRIEAALADVAPADRPRVHRLEALRRGEWGEAPPCPALPASLAYVIYTSGSTGAPKGVLVEQRGMLNHLRAKIETLGLTERDVVAQNASQCFDISVWQMLAALAVGGVVRIVSDATAHEPAALLAEVEREGVTILEVVPSLLRALLDEIEGDGAAGPPRTRLRWLIPTGEALPSDLCRRWLDLYPRVPMLNAYGPTECSDDVSHLPIRNAAEAGSGIAPIGRPVRRTRLHVLDPWQRPAPLGVPGELCVGGAGLGRGYLLDPARTARAFIPDAISGVAGERLYRTGDLARLLADGRIQFLGRLDHQVKIRGFRIEIGEIESVLRRHPGVGEAVVVARQDALAAGQIRLVAYVTPGPGGEEADGQALRSYLGERLPDYMVPSAFVALDRLPLTRNGKIDLHALPAPETALPNQKRTPPRTRTEKLLADIWRELLGATEVGLEDSFFALGGHSLLATRVLSRLRAELGFELPVRDLFEAPSLEELAARVDAARGFDTDLAVLPLVQVPPEAAGKLSFAQERLWFLDQLDPGSAAYNLFNAVLLQGTLAPPVLLGALREVGRRHATLRMTFSAVSGQPQQSICPELSLEMPEVDLSALPAQAVRAETVRWATLHARWPFDLERGPLVRAALLRWNPSEHVLLLSMHHIISDGWSLGVILAEVGALYPAFAADSPSPLPELSVQYPDYAWWQRSLLEGEVLGRQLAFWTEQLAGAPPALDLPGRGTRAAIRSNYGATRRFRLGSGLSAGLRALSRRQGTTLFMTLLAGFAALLNRYSGAQDLMIGVPVAGRSRPELERLIGFFVNTLVIRVRLDGAPDSEELLRRVRRVALDAFSHQDLPFEKLVAELNPERDLDRSPLFQVMFALQNVPAERVEVSGLNLSRFEIDTGTIRFELYLELMEDCDELDGALQISLDRYDVPFALRLVEHFRALLQGLANRTTGELAGLPLLSDCEQAQILREWNDTACDLPLEFSFQRLFAGVVATESGRIAASSRGRSLSYGELDARSNAVARHLQSLGMGPESIVAVLSERNLDFLTAVVGVFKAGAAYLPLDPRHPVERMRQVLEQSRSSVVLSSGSLLAVLTKATAGPTAGKTPLVIELESMLEHGSAEAPPPRGAIDNLAYVIFTSGSTGIPKGAMVEQRGMLNHLWAKIETLGLTGRDVVAQNASQCFDISVWQLLAALLVGGTVQIVADEVAHDPRILLEEVEREGVTILEVVPSLLRVLLDRLEANAAPRPSLTRLRWLIPTGEALPFDLCQRWQALYPFVPLLNAYGPTECSDDVSHMPMRNIPENERGIAPIGRPVRQTQLYVLDTWQRPVPLGVSGELCVSGQGVGRGYLFDPAKTAVAFVPAPFSGRCGDRLYRTGDLVRCREDGRLEFLGRLDHQVKIRGFRLELGEIEAILGEHPGLSVAVVTARPEPSGGQRLVAYAVPHDPGSLTPQDLRAFLRDRLPEYAIPTAWVMLDALPLTRNGKIDRAALPDTGYISESERYHSDPRNEAEAGVAEIFADVIGLAKVGAFDDFFDLGGHSLLATQTIWRLRERFGTELTLRTLFQAPTVAALAEVIQLQILEEIEELSEERVDMLLESDPNELKN